MVNDQLNQAAPGTRPTMFKKRILIGLFALSFLASMSVQEAKATYDLSDLTLWEKGGYTFCMLAPIILDTLGTLIKEQRPSNNNCDRCGHLPPADNDDAEKSTESHVRYWGHQACKVIAAVFYIYLGYLATAPYCNNIYAHHVAIAVEFNKGNLRR